LQRWAASSGKNALAQAVDRFEQNGPGADALVLPGPTGERNVYSLCGRSHVLCLADRD